MTFYECTQENYEDLLQQKLRLETELAEATKALGEAADADNNTWHDNPAFDAANETIRRLMAQIADVKAKIDKVRIVEAPSVGDVIGVGTKATIRINSGEPFDVEIVGVVIPGAETRQVSTSSPLGRALLESREGGVIAYDAPAGRMSAEVISIS